MRSSNLMSKYAVNFSLKFWHIHYDAWLFLQSFINFELINLRTKLNFTQNRQSTFNFNKSKGYDILKRADIFQFLRGHNFSLLIASSSLHPSS